MENSVSKLSEERKNEIARMFCKHILLSIYRNKGDAKEIVNQLVDETDSALMKMMDENKVPVDELKLFLFEEIMELRSLKTLT